MSIKDIHRIYNEHLEASTIKKIQQKTTYLLKTMKMSFFFWLTGLLLNIFGFCLCGDVCVSPFCWQRNGIELDGWWEGGSGRNWRMEKAWSEYIVWKKSIYFKNKAKITNGITSYFPQFSFIKSWIWNTDK